MSDRTPRIERLIERAAGFASGTSLHPALVVTQVIDAAEASVRDTMVANAYLIAMSASDAGSFSDHAGQLRAAILEALAAFARARRLRLPSAWVVEMETREGVAAGEVVVEATFRNVAPAGASVIGGQTTAIRRLSGVFLTVSGGDRLRVTHTPFVIGRSRECDLSVFDLAMSRRHACIDQLTDGTIVVRDMGSRNGITFEGARLDEAVLIDGTEFILGSTTFRFAAPV